MLRHLVIFLFFFFAFCRPGTSAPNLDVTLSRDTLQIDETVLLTIKLSWPKEEGSYSFGFPELPLRNLSLKNEGQSQETFVKDGREWTSKVFTLELAPNGVGEGKIEEFALTYVNSSSTEGSAQFKIQPLSLEIKKPAFRLPSWIAIVVGSLAAFALAVIAAVKQWRQKPPEKAGPEIVAQNTPRPEDQALQQLSQTDSVYEISKIFREFLAPYSGENPKSVEKILEKLDELKFSGGSNPENLKQIRNEIISYLESKRIVGSPA